MGKLHTLRRAIVRDPKRWANGWRNGARQDACGEWYPTWCNSYTRFIQRTINTLRGGSSSR